MYTLNHGRVIYRMNDFTAEVIEIPEFKGTTYHEFEDYLLKLPRQAAIAAVFADDFRTNVGMCVKHKPAYVSLVDWGHKTRSLLMCHPHLRSFPNELLPRKVKPYRDVWSLNIEKNGTADFSEKELVDFAFENANIDFLMEVDGKIMSYPVRNQQDQCRRKTDIMERGVKREIATYESVGNVKFDERTQVSEESTVQESSSTESYLENNYLTAYLEKVRTLYTSTGIKLDCSIESNYYDPVFLREWMNTEYVAHVVQAGRILDRLVLSPEETIAELGSGPSILAPYAQHYRFGLQSNDINAHFIQIAANLGNKVRMQPNGAVINNSDSSIYWLSYQLSSQPGIAIDVVTKHPDAKVLILDTTHDFDGVELFTKMSVAGRSIYYRNMDFKRVVHQDKTNDPPNYAWTNLFDEHLVYCVTTPAGANLMRKIQRFGLNPSICFLPCAPFKDLVNVVNHTKSSVFLIDDYFVPKYFNYFDMKTGVITPYSTFVLGRSNEIYVRQGCFVHVGQMLSSVRILKRKGSDNNYFYALRTMTLEVKFQGVRRRLIVHVYRSGSIGVDNLVRTQQRRFFESARKEEILKIEPVDMRW